MAEYRGYAEDMGKLFKEGNDSVIYGNASFNNRKAAERLAQERHAAGKAAGSTLTGYEPVTLKTAGRGGNWRTSQFDMPIYSAAPEAPAPAPEPVAPKPTPEPEPELPVKLSERAAEANAYTDAYERKVLPYKGNYIFGDESVKDNFDQQYGSNLQENRKSYINKPDKNKEAQSFADNYKLNLGNMLVPSNRT